MQKFYIYSLLFFIRLIPARKRKDRAIIRAIAITSKGVIIKMVVFKIVFMGFLLNLMLRVF